MNFNDMPGKHFWSNGYQYGTVQITDGEATKSVRLTSLFGDLDLNSFTLNGYGQMTFKEMKRLKAGQPVEFEIENND